MKIKIPQVKVDEKYGTEPMSLLKTGNKVIEAG
jgi:hypothetical protein